MSSTAAPEKIQDVVMPTYAKANQETTPCPRRRFSLDSKRLRGLLLLLAGCLIGLLYAHAGGLAYLNLALHRYRYGKPSRTRDVFMSRLGSTGPVNKDCRFFEVTDSSCVKGDDGRWEVAALLESQTLGHPYSRRAHARFQLRPEAHSYMVEANYRVSGHVHVVPSPDEKATVDVDIFHNEADALENMHVCSLQADKSAEEIAKQRPFRNRIPNKEMDIACAFDGSGEHVEKTDIVRLRQFMQKHGHREMSPTWLNITLALPQSDGSPRHAYIQDLGVDLHSGLALGKVQVTSPRKSIVAHDKSKTQAQMKKGFIAQNVSATAYDGAPQNPDAGHPGGIYGHFQVTGSISLHTSPHIPFPDSLDTTSSAPISVHIKVQATPKQQTQAVMLRAEDALLNVTLKLIDMNGSDGGPTHSFDISASSGGPLSVAIAESPSSATLFVDAEAKDGPASLFLDPNFKGTYVVKVVDPDAHPSLVVKDRTEAAGRERVFGESLKTRYVSAGAVGSRNEPVELGPSFAEVRSLKSSARVVF